MTGLIKTGLGIFTGGTSVWLPYVIIGAVAASGGAYTAYKWEHAFVVSATAERDQARNGLHFMTEDRDRQSRDADHCHKAVSLQNDRIEAMRADVGRAEQIARDADTAAKVAKQTAQTQIDKWKEQARAHPEQTVKLGPIARDAVRVLISP